jgi:hypothetical protein
VSYSSLQLGTGYISEINNIVTVDQKLVSQLQPDEEFRAWLRDRLSELGTPKADLTAVTDAAILISTRL